MTVTNGLKGVLALALMAALSGCNESADGKTTNVEEDYPLDTQQKRVSYLLGHDIANEWQAKGVVFDTQALALAIHDVMAKREMRLSKEEVAKTIETYQKDTMLRQQELLKQQHEMQAQLDAEFDQQAENNLKAGQTFLAENAQKEGVVTLDSGLQYKVITAGTGAVPAATDNVEIHYRGTLLDGTEFDSSYQRGSTASFVVTQGLVPGWVEALQLMPEGSKWELYVPSDLGYGPGGFGPVGPNATLRFELELLKVNPSDK